MMQPVVIDVETQLSFRDVGGFEPKKLKISVAGLYDYASDKYFAFEENELPHFFKYLENSSFIIGFNHIDFDLPALSPYYIGDLQNFPMLIYCRKLKKVLDLKLVWMILSKETLGAHKTGHGLLAIEYYREGKIKELKEYCLGDVKLTKQLYEYGKEHNQIFYKKALGRQPISVSWGHNSQASQINLTMPW